MKNRFGICLIIIGITIPIFILFKNKINNVTYEININNKLIYKKYFGVLEIPKINLKREIYNIDDSNNNVNINIFVHKNSIFPDKHKSNVILAGHSGNGRNAYFRNLYKLNINDEVKLYFNNYIYTYQIKEIEYQNKTGTLYIKEDFDKMITLITCTKNNKNTQTLYYGELKMVEKC